MRGYRSRAGRLLFAGLALVLLSAAAIAEETGSDLVIRAKPPLFGVLGPGSASVGELIDRGALSLRSADKRFGGLSGLLVSDDGTRFLAITDSSHWITGTLRYEGGLLSDIAGAKIAPLLDLDGKPLKGKRGDAEGIAGSMSGDVYISFEGDHRIWRYDFGAAGLAAVPVNVEAPAALRNAPRNKGLEAITLLTDGRLLAVTEHDQNADGTTKAWLIDPRNPDGSKALSLANMAPFEVTDVRQLPDGSILTLERRFDRTKGIGFACRRIALQALSNDRPVDGPVIANGGMRNIVANMEGLAVREGKDGETFVYMLSDNNFGTIVQRTLLIMYKLKPKAQSAGDIPPAASLKSAMGPMNAAE